MPISRSRRLSFAGGIPVSCLSVTFRRNARTQHRELQTGLRHPLLFPAEDGPFHTAGGVTDGLFCLRNDIHHRSVCPLCFIAVLTVGHHVQAHPRISWYAGTDAAGADEF